MRLLWDTPARFARNDRVAYWLSIVIATFNILWLADAIWLGLPSLAWLAVFNIVSYLASAATHLAGRHLVARHLMVAVSIITIFCGHVIAGPESDMNALFAVLMMLCFYIFPWQSEKTSCASAVGLCVAGAAATVIASPILAIEPIISAQVAADNIATAVLATCLLYTAAIGWLFTSDVARYEASLRAAIDRANTSLDAETRMLDQQTRLMTRQKEMFSIIAHELRTPAAAIDMLASDTATGTEYGRDLKASSEHLLHVIDDLRQAISPEVDITLHEQPVNPTRLIQETRRQTEPLLSHRVLTLNTRIETFADDVRYLSDRYRLRSILTNLIRNAFYHSDGSVIELSLSINAVDSNVHRLEFRVEDDGKGIPDEDIERLFEPFTRGDTQSRGTGVGLYLVKSWTQRLGGEIRYERSALGGACFVVTLQLPVTMSREPQQDGAAGTDAASNMLQPLTVLLVEDDDLLRKIQHRVLESAFGCNIVLARNGRHALVTMERHTVDLVVTDYFMPEMNGVELISALRSQRSSVPVIALTAATIGNEQTELLDAGADIVLTKPLKIREFADAVLELKERQRFAAAQTRPKAVS